MSRSETVGKFTYLGNRVSASGLYVIIDIMFGLFANM